MVSLLRSPWTHIFESLLDIAESSLMLCAPYVGFGPCSLIVDRISKRGANRSIEVLVLTDLSRDNLPSGATDASSLLRLAEAIPRTKIRFLPSLQAKVYIADERRGVITSSNLTESGVSRNFEYGVPFDEPQTVAAVRADILNYSDLGSPVDDVQLRALVQATADLRRLSQEFQRSADQKLREEFDRRLADADTEILRARTAVRTARAIFADAILHLLRNGPLRTDDLNRSIQGIHPDLCDDTVDRVIDGQHFGKKWKHGVRTAQVYLRRAGRIERDGKRWRLARYP